LRSKIKKEIINIGVDNMCVGTKNTRLNDIGKIYFVEHQRYHCYYFIPTGILLMGTNEKI
jgi:hypothetical protein